MKEQRNIKTVSKPKRKRKKEREKEKLGSDFSFRMKV